MSKPMMKCGHAANGVAPDGAPVCVICAMIRSVGEDWREVADAPDLSIRTAICSLRFGPKGIHGMTPSAIDLPFFEHRPKEAQDFYYCGCCGWD